MPAPCAAKMPHVLTHARTSTCPAASPQEEFINGAALRLECNCRGDLALRHRECIMKWVQVKGSNVCELCKAEIRNIPAPPPRPTDADLPALDEAYFNGEGGWERREGAQGTAARGRSPSGGFCCLLGGSHDARPVPSSTHPKPSPARHPLPPRRPQPHPRLHALLPGPRLRLHPRHMGGHDCVHVSTHGGWGVGPLCRIALHAGAGAAAACLSACLLKCVLTAAPPPFAVQPVLRNVAGRGAVDGAACRLRLQHHGALRLAARASWACLPAVPVTVPGAPPAAHCALASLPGVAGTVDVQAALLRHAPPGGAAGRGAARAGGRQPHSSRAAPRGGGGVMTATSSLSGVACLPPALLILSVLHLSETLVRRLYHLLLPKAVFAAEAPPCLFFLCIQLPYTSPCPAPS